MARLRISNIQKRLGGLPILQGISLDLREGEVISLLGQSGSGKTTLLRSVAGLEVPDQGVIALDETTFFDAERRINVPPQQRGLGFVFQSYALWPHRTVFENVEYGLKLRRMSSADAAARVKEVLERLGLGAFAERYPHQLSGGQQQRVALARSLAYQPPVLLLDEPLSNLDAKLRDEARSWLRVMIKQAGLSALYVTHDQVEALAVSDRILFLHGGRIEQQGTPEELYNQPATANAAEFLGTNNRLEGTVRIDGSGAKLVGDGWSLRGRLLGDAKDGDPGIAYVRLDRMRLDAAGHGESAVELDLVSTLYVGERFECLLEGRGLRLRIWANTRMQPGRYTASVAPDDLWIFAR